MSESRNTAHRRRNVTAARRRPQLTAAPLAHTSVYMQGPSPCQDISRRKDGPSSRGTPGLPGNGGAGETAAVLHGAGCVEIKRYLTETVGGVQQ